MSFRTALLSLQNSECDSRGDGPNAVLLDRTDHGRALGAEGGVEARWERNRRMLEMLEEWVEAHPGYAFFAPAGRRAWTVSALKPPKGRTERQVVADVARHGYSIGAGLDALADHMVRIGHMGDLTPGHFEGLLGGMG